VPPALAPDALGRLAVGASRTNSSLLKSDSGSAATLMSTKGPSRRVMSRSMRAWVQLLAAQSTVTGTGATLI
jgi:hypothetical protein